MKLLYTRVPPPNESPTEKVQSYAHMHYAHCTVQTAVSYGGRSVLAYKICNTICKEEEADNDFFSYNFRLFRIRIRPFTRATP